MNSPHKTTTKMFFLLVLTMMGCGKVEESSPTPAPVSPPQVDPVKQASFIETIPFHQEARDAISNKYSFYSTFEICVQKIHKLSTNNSVIEVIRITNTKNFSCSSTWLSDGPLVGDFTLVGFRLLSQTGVDIGRIYRFNSTNNLVITEFCTGEFASNCSIETEKVVQPDQSIRISFKGIKVNEATVTKSR